MARLPSALCMLLACSSVFAQTAPAAAPAEESNMLAVIIFAVLFVGLCVGFVALMIRNEKRRKASEGKE